MYSILCIVDLRYVMPLFIYLFIYIKQRLIDWLIVSILALALHTSSLFTTFCCPCQLIQVDQCNGRKTVSYAVAKVKHDKKLQKAQMIMTGLTLKERKYSAQTTAGIEINQFSDYQSRPRCWLEQKMRQKAVNRASKTVFNRTWKFWSKGCRGLKYVEDWILNKAKG